MKWFIKYAEEILASVLMGVIFILVIAEVASRLFTGTSITWVQEITQTMFVWSVFIGTGAAVKRIKLISIDMLYNVLPGKGKVVFNLLILIVMLTLLMFLLVNGFKFMIKFANDVMPMTGLPSWYLYAAVPVGTLFIIVRTVQAYGLEIFRLLKNPSDASAKMPNLEG